MLGFVRPRIVSIRVTTRRASINGHQVTLPLQGVKKIATSRPVSLGITSLIRACFVSQQHGATAHTSPMKRVVIECLHSGGYLPSKLLPSTTVEKRLGAPLSTHLMERHASWRIAALHNTHRTARSGDMANLRVSAKRAAPSPRRELSFKNEPDCSFA